MRRFILLPTFLLSALSCSDPLTVGSVRFCVQWINRSDKAVTFAASDDDLNVIVQSTLAAATPGGEQRSPVLYQVGQPPMHFSANQGFGSVTVTPTGSNHVLFVEAPADNTGLRYTEAAANCPP